MDGRTEFRQQNRVLYYMQSHGKNWLICVEVIVCCTSVVFETQCRSKISVLMACRMLCVTVCRIDVDTETVLEGTISDNDMPRSLIDGANRSSRAVDCTWVLHGPPLYRVCQTHIRLTSNSHEVSAS